MKILVATRNAHKLQEIRAMLGGASVVLVGADEFGGLPDVEEDGATFEANAVKKATSLARASGLWALADDSGLEVCALGNAPGVRSARYAGEPADHAANNARLLRELEGVADRRARFRCALALADPGGAVRVVEGSCEGAIVLAARGSGGFGYDPLFEPEGSGRTFAEMAAGEKDALSHRGRALSAARRAWRDVLGWAG